MCWVTRLVDMEDVDVEELLVDDVEVLEDDVM